jgi:hypothetical protein
MSPRTRAELEALVTATVAERLHAAPADIAPPRDLRTLRAFSSFAGVDILERLEAVLQVEVPAGQLSAERLCSVAALTDLFLSTLVSEEAITP